MFLLSLFAVSALITMQASTCKAAHNVPDAPDKETGNRQCPIDYYLATLFLRRYFWQDE